MKYLNKHPSAVEAGRDSNDAVLAATCSCASRVASRIFPNSHDIKNKVMFSLNMSRVASES